MEIMKIRLSNRARMTPIMSEDKIKPKQVKEMLKEIDYLRENVMRTKELSDSRMDKEIDDLKADAVKADAKYYDLKKKMNGNILLESWLTKNLFNYYLALFEINRSCVRLAIDGSDDAINEYHGKEIEQAKIRKQELENKFNKLSLN
jgi:hypothetical protein